MTDLQKRLLHTFKKFKQICDENNLQYFANGGTKLGALRHKGFIPWDDDMDISMPLNDYRKLLKLAAKSNSKQFGLTPSFEINDKSSYSVVSKFFDKDTTFIEDINRLGDTDNYHGVFIDIFPILWVPDDKQERFSYYEKLREFQYDVIFDNIYKLEISTPPQLRSKYKKLVKSYDLTKIGYVFEPGPPNHPEHMERTAYPAKTYSSYEEVPFEDTTIRIPIGAKQQLESQYGDWQKLPPREEQVNKHTTDGIFDLDNSYKVYEKKMNDQLVKTCVDNLVKYTGKLHRNLELTETRRVNEKEYYINELEATRNQLSNSERKVSELMNPGIKTSLRALGRAIRRKTKGL